MPFLVRRSGYYMNAVSVVVATAMRSSLCPSVELEKVLFFYIRKGFGSVLKKFKGPDARKTCGSGFGTLLNSLTFFVSTGNHQIWNGNLNKRNNTIIFRKYELFKRCYLKK
jgi:hypothetical protein